MYLLRREGFSPIVKDTGTMGGDLGENDWIEIGAHQGQINGLAWSSDGCDLYTASFEGGFKRWSLEDNGSLTLAKSIDVKTTDNDYVFDVVWSPSLAATVISRGGELELYDRDLTWRPLDGLQSVRADRLRFQPNGKLVALSEQHLPEGSKSYVPAVTIRAIDEVPRLIARNVIARDGYWSATDFTWQPTGSLLAILAENELWFVSSASGKPLETRWWVGRWANTINWISEDEIAVGFSNGDIRIYAWSDNRHSRDAGAFQPKTKTLLEFHDDHVIGLVSGGGDRFASFDRNAVNIWHANGEHLRGLRLPLLGEFAVRNIAIHPSRNILIAARGNTLYQCQFTTSGAGTAPISRNLPKIHTRFLEEILDRAGLLRPRVLTSDDVRANWQIASRADEAQALLDETLANRRSARILHTLANDAARAICAVWRDPDRADVITLENIWLRKVENVLQDEEKVREALLLALREKWSRSKADDKIIILAACFALGALSRSTYRASIASEFLPKACDELEDHDVRVKFKLCLKADAEIEAAADLQSLLRLIEDIVVLINNSRAAGRRSGHRKGKPELAETVIEDFIIVAAVQELEAVRKHLKASFPLAQSFVDGRPIDVFRLSTERRGDIAVGVLLPLSKGKGGTAEVLHALKREAQVRNVIMVGMAAGIKGKSKLLDVLIPRTVYDVGSVGTKDGKLVVEPEVGTMDARLSNMAAFLDMRRLARPPIRVISHKKMIAVPAKVDDINHDLVEAMLNVDRENVVGLEMEAAALTDAQTRHFGIQSTAYMMVKGVADYAGERPDMKEVEELSAFGKLKPHLTNPDPTKSPGLKKALQEEATRRALLVTLAILRKLP